MIAEELKLKEKLHPPDTITRTLQPNRKNKNQINETERFNTGQVVFSLLKFFYCELFSKNKKTTGLSHLKGFVVWSLLGWYDKVIGNTFLP